MGPKDTTVTVTLELDLTDDRVTTEDDRLYLQQAVLLAPALAGTVRLSGQQAAVICNMIAIYTRPADAKKAYYAVYGREEQEVTA